MSRNYSIFAAGGGALALAAALLLQGTFAFTPSTSKAEQPSGNDGQAAGPLPGADDVVFDSSGDPLTPLRRFLDSKPATSQADDIKNVTDKLKSSEQKATCVIATVPHPTKSGFGYWYDLSLDAVERALERADYVPDSAWSPPEWRRPPSKDAKDSSPEKGDAAELPGMMLFRSANSSEKRLCLVWLIGETPTSGIAKASFKKAVELISKYGLGDQTSLRVLGPFFSGSQSSLIAALLHAASVEKPNPGMGLSSITIRNGSATAIRPEDFDVLAQGKAPLHLDYQTTVIPNQTSRKALYHFLANPSYPWKNEYPTRVAVLHEADTGFGTAQTSITGDEIFVPFPIHLSALQGAHNKEILDQLAQLGLPRSSGLAIPQEEGQREGEVRSLIPEQSPLTTAAMNDLIMKNTLSSLTRGRVKYVELIATDPRDKILLAAFVRNRCPDAQLFTTEGDFMLAHPDFNAAMRGTIIGATYPMDAKVLAMPPYDRQAKTRELRLLFCNQSFQGCYNAMLTLLDDGSGALVQKMLGYGPTEKEPSQEYPNIWISVIGQNGAVIPVYKRQIDEKLGEELAGARVFKRVRSDQVPTGDSADKDDYPHSTGHFSTLSLCGLFLVSGWLCWFLFRILEINPDDGPPRPGAVPLAARLQRVCLAGICLCPGCLYAWLFSLALMPTPAGAHAVIVNSLVLLVTCGMWLFLCCFFVNRCLGRYIRIAWPWASSPRPPASGAAPPAAADVSVLELGAHVLLLVGFLAASGMIVYNRYLFTDGENISLYFDRVTHLRAGFSPLLPAGLLVVCLASWCFFLFKRLNYVQYHSVSNPFASISLLQSLNRLGSRLEDAIWRPASPTGASLGSWLKLFAGRIMVLALPVLIVALIFAPLRMHWIPTIEGWLFDLLMFAGLFLGAILTIYVSLHFYAVWNRLRDLLKEVAKLPLPKAFDRLPDSVRSIIDKALYANRPGHAARDVARQQMQMLALTLPTEALKNGLPVEEQERVDRLATILKEAQALPGSSAELSASDRTSIDQALRDAFSAVMPLLQFFWQYRSLSEKYTLPTADRHDAASKAESGEQPAISEAKVRSWLDSAEDFVAVEITRYLSQFFAQLRNLLNAVVLSGFLLVLSITVYPFHPQSLLLLYLVGLLASVAALAVWVLIGINRDEVMSHLSGSTPNRFTPDMTFFREIFQYVLPILGLLMVQFPSVGSLIRSILEPLFRI